MTTSEFLKEQAQVLIAVDILRRARLEDLAAKAAAIIESGAELLDRDGLRPATNPERMGRLAVAAAEFLAAAGHPRAVKFGPGRAESAAPGQLREAV